MKERTLGKLAISGVLAFGGLGLSAANSEQADAATVRTYSCSKTAEQWHPLKQGEIVIVKASGVVIPADESVDGVKQYDDNPNTATVIGLKSKDDKSKTWVVNVDYPGSMKVMKCGATATRTEYALGVEAAKLDARLGSNDPLKSVQLQWVRK